MSRLAVPALSKGYRHVSDWNTKLVKTSPLVLRLYSVLAARGEGEDQDSDRSSALQQFVEGVPKWWEPILTSPKWLAHFITNPQFRKWTQRHCRW
jgi:hypothetical protein